MNNITTKEYEDTLRDNGEVANAYKEAFMFGVIPDLEGIYTMYMLSIERNVQFKMAEYAYETGQGLEQAPIPDLWKEEFNSVIKMETFVQLLNNTRLTYIVDGITINPPQKEVW